MMGMEYVGLAQVAEILGVTPEGAAVLAQRDDFPVPAVDSTAEPLWDLDAVEAWSSRRRSE